MGALKVMRGKFYFKSFTFMFTFLIIYKIAYFHFLMLSHFHWQSFVGENVQGRRMIHRDHSTGISIEKESMHSHGITSTR
jgi:hypothetical protein